MAYLDSGNAETFNGMRVPKSNAGSEEDSFITCQLFDDIVDIGIGKVRWWHDERRLGPGERHRCPYLRHFGAPSRSLGSEVSPVQYRF